MSSIHVGSYTRTGTIRRPHGMSEGCWPGHTQQGSDLVPVDIKGDAVQSYLVAIALGQVPDRHASPCAPSWFSRRAWATAVTCEQALLTLMHMQGTS